VLNPRKNNCAALYMLLGTFYLNWKCFQGRLVEPSAQSEFVSRILKHNYNTWCLEKYHVTMDLGEIRSV